MADCECGCGEAIEPKPDHRWRPARFKPGHHTRVRAREGRIKLRYMPKPEEIPSGLCECGCGGKTAIAQVTLRSKRYFKGHPLPCLSGHHHHVPSGPEHYAWKGGRIIRRGYGMVRMVGDPRADKSGYVYEHRLVWEEANGPLEPNQVVHHINGDPLDNRLENLIAMTRSAHISHHKKRR